MPEEKSELQIEREKIYTQAVEQKRAMSALKDSGGFQQFLKLLQTQIDQRYTESLQMPLGLDSVVQDLYKKGEMAGLKLAMDYVNVLIEYADATIQMYKALEVEKEEENAGSKE